MLRRWTVSPEAFRRIALGAVAALTLTIISGAAVRLTGSGLGCDTWPKCDATSVVAPLGFHPWVEFGNRLINALVTVLSLGPFLAALRRSPQRRDLTWLSFGLVIGLVIEVVVGGIVVYSKLNPVLVSIHFVLGLLFLAVAVMLHLRAGVPDGALAPAPLVGRSVVVLSTLGLALLAVVVSLGTVVTSTGPHGGAPGTPRYHLALHAVAQLHGTSVEVYLGLTLVLLWTLVRTGAPPAVMRRAEVMLVAMAAQAAVGYTQYFSGDPVGIVAVHVAGASILVIAVLHFWFGLWSRSVSLVEPEPDSSGAALEPVS